MWIAHFRSWKHWAPVTKVQDAKCLGRSTCFRLHADVPLKQYELIVALKQLMRPFQGPSHGPIGLGGLIAVVNRRLHQLLPFQRQDKVYEAVPIVCLNSMLRQWRPPAW